MTLDLLFNEERKVDFMINNEHILNYTDLVDNYISLNDWRVKENSTVT